jgi:exopolysaccharide production protein ExoZ
MSGIALNRLDGASSQVNSADMAGGTDAPVKSVSPKLGWVELGRGLAALVVVAFHASIMMREPQYSGQVFLPEWFSLGFLGVDFFFVLSGFIILYVHLSDVGRPDRLARYAWRRVTRIFPTYWIIFAAALLINIAMQSTKAPVSAGWLAEQVTLVPGFEPWVGPAWTLRFELLFYALFSTFLIGKRLGFAVLGVWLILILQSTAGAPDYSVLERQLNFWYIVVNPLNLNFFMGMALAFALKKGKGVNALTLFFASVGALFLWSGFQHGFDWFAPVRFLGVGSISAALLGGLIYCDRKGWSLPRAMTWLGSISYSLYLCHVIVMGLFLATLSHTGLYRSVPEPVIFAGQIGIAIAAAAVIYHFCEKPILAWAQRKVI